MIKSNVTVIGTVNRPVELKTGRDGKPFVTFGILVNLEGNQESKGIHISVASDGDEDLVLNIEKGDRIKVQGVLTFKHMNDSLYFNLSLDRVCPLDIGEDSITGQIQFRGTLGGKEVIEKEGKKGSYFAFDAYSSEKVTDEQYSYIWVHFIDFSGGRPDWLVPRAGINAEGKLELDVFNDRVALGCRVESLSPWAKNTSKQ